MAIRVQGTTIIDDSRNLTNIESLNNAAVKPRKPTIVSPIDGFQTLDSSITFQSSDFEGAVVSDDHASSDWELATDSGFTNIVASLTDNTSNLTSWTVSNLSLNTYFVRVRHSGATLGDSEFSDPVSFSIVSQLIYSWGYNNSGQLGTGDFSNYSSPVQINSSITDWTDIESGQSFSVAKGQNDVLYSWGNGDKGRTGLGIINNRSTPQQVLGSINDISSLSVTEKHTAVLTNTGTVFSWGQNNYGQLGDGTSVDRSSPVTVIGGITDWKTVKVGSTPTTFGITNDGKLYGWGRGDQTDSLFGNNGNNQSSPAQVQPSITDWEKVFSGKHVFAIRSDGTLYAWGGNNQYGSYGVGTTDGSSSPRTVLGGITNWELIENSPGDSAYGLTSDGRIYAWGKNDFGQLGTNDTTSKSSPEIVTGGITDWTDVSAGDIGAYGIRSNGELYAWGSDAQGELGQNQTNVSFSSPVTVVGGLTDWIQVSALIDQSVSALRID